MRLREDRFRGNAVEPCALPGKLTGRYALHGVARKVAMRRFPPSRIVCLTEETVETLYLLGEQDRIVGVSGYAVRPPQVRREKPRVSAFTSADIPKILALEPDLVLTFSDLQAGIAAELIRSGVAVHASNQRDIAGILHHDSNPRRPGRSSRQGGKASQRLRGKARRSAGLDSRAATAKGLFRGVGRSSYQRYRLGVRVHRDRRRR